MSKKIRTYPAIGNVAFVKSRRARRFTLSVKPWRGVRVTLPWNSRWQDAENFMMQHREWIKEKVEQPVADESELKLLHAKALEYLPGRTSQLAREQGFTYNRVTVRRSRTRWGSCSSANNINLSIFLMNLPSHLVDYVIIHELVHTIHRNHSSEFWDRLDRHTGGRARQLAQEMKKFRITL